MQHNYKIREVIADDKKPFLDLLNNIYSKQQRYDWNRDEKFWKWKYESNVYGKPIIHVIENNNEIVGSGTLWPWKFIVRGEVFHVYQPCDTTINFTHQGKGLFSLLYSYHIDVLKELKVPFVYNFPNKNSLRGNLKLGWHYMGKLPWIVKPLHPIGTLRLLKSKKKCSPLPLKPNDKIDPHSCYEVVDKSVYFKKYISTYRENGFFEWRYQQHPYFQYGQVIVEFGRYKAGAIFSINHKEQSREMAVVDIFGDPIITDKLFGQIQAKAKEYGVDLIVALYNKYYQMNALLKKGYIKLQNKNMVLLPFDIRIEEEFTKYDNWNAIASMHDSI